jgi:hypothetical protein
MVICQPGMRTEIGTSPRPPVNLDDSMFEPYAKYHIGLGLTHISYRSFRKFDRCKLMPCDSGGSEPH